MTRHKGMQNQAGPGTTISDEARLLAAAAGYRSEAKARPGDPEPLLNLGSVLIWIGRAEEAEPALRSALAIDQDSAKTRFFLALCLMTQGRYREAWPFHEARMDVPQLALAMPDWLSSPMWRGEPIDGKSILVTHEQGFGDQIMFARFLPELVARARDVSLLIGPPLAALFRHSFPQVKVIAVQADAQAPRVDHWMGLESLAAIADATLDRLPQPPYLTTPVTWATPSPGFKVGLVTKGGNNYSNDVRRSLPPDLAEQLRTELPGRVINIEPEHTGAKDFAQTAAIIAALDLVVSVDTAAAHLAGAMGKPCFVLIPGLQTDWRWLRGRSDSPWYPHHRLFRSGIDGGWGGAVERLLADAREFAGRHSAA